MATHIVVTQEHIAGGVPGERIDCALARAFRAAGFPNAEVGIALFTLDGTHYTELPAVAYNFREDFDENIRGEPFEFDLPD